jgi:hypothetical protein
MLRQKVFQLWARTKANSWFCFTLAVFTVTSTGLSIISPLGKAPDEEYHFAAIRTYAQQYSPFIHHQSDLTQTGDLVRYPSYMYHYLLSFPYRALHGLGLSDTANLHVLRLTSVALGITTLILLYRLLTKVTSKKIAQLSVILFALLPITPILFSGLNYDDLLMPTIFTSLLLVISLYKKPSLQKLLSWMALLGFGCLVKYSFLPIAVSEFIFMTVVMVRQHRTYRKLFSLKAFLIPMVAIEMVFALTSAGLVLERYGVNLVRYHAVVPACEQLHSTDACNSFYLYDRNDTARLKNSDAPRKNIFKYAFSDWTKNMVNGLVYPSTYHILSYFILAFSMLAVAATMVTRRLGFNDPYMGSLILAFALFYVATVFLENYSIYRNLGQPYAINGRYLLPALPLLFVTAFSNLRATIDQHRWLRSPLIPSTVMALLVLVNLRLL